MGEVVVGCTEVGWAVVGEMGGGGMDVGLDPAKGQQAQRVSNAGRTSKTRRAMAKLKVPSTGVADERLWWENFVVDHANFAGIGETTRGPDAASQVAAAPSPFMPRAPKGIVVSATPRTCYFVSDDDKMLVAEKTHQMKRNTPSTRVAILAEGAKVRGLLVARLSEHAWKRPGRALEAGEFQEMQWSLPKLVDENCDIDELPGGEATVDDWCVLTQLLRERVAEMLDFAMKKDSSAAYEDVMSDGFGSKRPRLPSPDPAAKRANTALQRGAGQRGRYRPSGGSSWSCQMCRWAAILEGFFGLFHKGKLTIGKESACNSRAALVRDDVLFTQAGRQFGSGALRALLCATRGRPGDSPLFVAKKLVRKKVQVATLAHTGLVAGVKRLAAAAGLRPEDYAGHSLRRGRATAAMQLEVHTAYIKSQGDWRSDCYERYCMLNAKQRFILPGAMAEAAAALN
ncbi:hypothetical protein CYMTET_49402 [Cymbomonas tetramitiformis]|uniref:Tyr recombinase domain-containing protein n=1 Tax=Cymbomonas tetramitiformis TaxID=36881 RepID=A0AAE0BRY2_9CHLO|nr:hypothetical protein CYMTET_49402 [Cymbomonas tetramitiformis]